MMNGVAIANLNAAPQIGSRHSPSRRFWRLSLLLLVIMPLLLAGCRAEVEHADVEELTHLHGKTETAVVAELGTPSYTNVMTLTQSSTLPELYIEIHNTYNPSDPTIDGVQIKELRWIRRGFTEAVFMHRVNGTWTVLESCRWKDGVVF